MTDADTTENTVSLGSCPTCCGPAQFVDDGSVRHVDLRETARSQAMTDTKERELADQARMVHDFPRLMEFYSKHALGSLLPPSCLTCGQTVHGAKGATDGPAICHGELPNIVVCAKCTAAIQSVSAAPQENLDGSVFVQRSTAPPQPAG